MEEKEGQRQGKQYVELNRSSEKSESPKVLQIVRYATTLE